MENHLLGFYSREEWLRACSLLSKPAHCERPVRMQATGNWEGCLGAPQWCLDLKLPFRGSLCKETFVERLILSNSLGNAASDLAFQVYIVFFLM